MYNKSMQTYDFIFAGGGGAALGLACALLDSPLRDCSMLIIDRDAKNENDRTWCFWGNPETPFASIARVSWNKISVRDEMDERIFDFNTEGDGTWRYWMVRGIDYYRHTRQRLAEQPNVRMLQGSIDGFTEEPERVLVHAGNETYAGRWVFDSIIRPGDLNLDRSKHHVLKQHFTGWEIETPQPMFDPTRAVMFDFRTRQENDLRFFYVLPFSPTLALVEYTIFSSELLERDAYDAALREFLAEKLGVHDYRVDFVEHNWIPMTDYPFKRRAGARILNIGTKGGLVKPSTGYAFKRMQRDARSIVDSLVKHGNPFQVRAAPGRYRFYDTLLLQILYRQGHLMKPIFTQLFQRNPILRIFHFLDDDASIFEDLALIASLPPLPFLRALVRTKLLRKI